MRNNIKNFLLVAIGLALLVPAPVALLYPDVAATAFGVPAASAEARAYLLAIGARDVALGVWLLAMVALRAESRLLAASVWSIAIVAGCDALNVGLFTRWQNVMSLGPHIGGLVVLIALGFWLWPARNRSDKK